MILNNDQTATISELLNLGKLGVMPTDTIYGIHCNALDTDLIDKVYQIKERPANMPLITLVSSIDDLELFNVEINEFSQEQMKKFWPGRNTLIFKTQKGATRSFRLPDNNFLLEILKLTGPLISTSANIHAKPNAKNVSEAVEYFGDGVDFYVDGGELNNPPSSVFMIKENSLEQLR